ncbi:MAG TPA: response regulator transcription factor [Prolixibacteraceae bacterium]|nr:response regulator transcription factor [Prolixibacteraceae bacterium]
MVEPVKIMIVDDHKIVRDGIRALLLGERNIRWIGEAADADSLFVLLKDKAPDVLILDIQLPGRSGVEILGELQEKYPGIRVLILSSNSDEAIILDAVKAGARGFLPKDTSADELLTAIMSVYKHEGYFGSKISKIIYNSYIGQVTRKEDKDIGPLSDREVEILTLLADGFTNREIADKLFLSPRTVDTHKANIMAKLQLNSTANLVKYALRKGYIKL